MFIFIGIGIVLVGVVGGYLMEHGNLSVLFQPAELFIIFGAAIGSLLIANPFSHIMHMVKNLLRLITFKETGKKEYLGLLSFLYRLAQQMKKEGILSIEPDIEDPKGSRMFKSYPAIYGKPEALNLLCDNLKLALSGVVQGMELDNSMELEIETNYEHALSPSHGVARVADALPGLGIVAAVMGVVITMGKISEPPEVLGESIGAALVGTFLGVLLCYGIVGPFAVHLEYLAKDERTFQMVIKNSLVPMIQGVSPIIAIDAGRKIIPPNERPTFVELETHMKSVG